MLTKEPVSVCWYRESRPAVATVAERWAVCAAKNPPIAAANESSRHQAS